MKDANVTDLIRTAVENYIKKEIAEEAQQMIIKRISKQKITR